jgi:hypothetical protein
MSTDITIPLDGKISLTSEPHPYRIARAAPKPVTRRRANIEAQAERLKALEARGHVVKIGKTGVTVFRR